MNFITLACLKKINQIIKLVSMELIVKFLPLFGVVALIFVFLKSGWVSKQAVGMQRCHELQKTLQMVLWLS